MESDFGIEGYVSDFQGFTCVLKQRYQDFLVNEIDTQGNVVHLTSLEAPSGGKNEEQGPSRLGTSGEVLWSSEIDQQLKELADGNRSEAVAITCQDFDKAKRTAIHTLIRERYPELQSATSTLGDGSQVITVTRGGAGQPSRKRRHWPTDRKGDYVRFVLYKENKDSHFALSLISRLMGLKPNSIGLAGTKDRRGVTTQLATVYRTPAEKLASLNSQLRGIKLGNFEYAENQLYLGDSKGNRFTVVMRNIQAERETVEAAVQKWSERGFVNFYGTQRFGTTAVATHTVGRAILRKQWSEAVDLLLHPRDDAPEDVAECYRTWASTKDPAQALAAIPSKRRHTCLEGHLLAGLKKHGVKDFANAFRSVPRNSRTLYVHALQSYIWNKLISIRIAKYGQKILVGDVVVTSTEEDQIHTVTAEETDKFEPFQLRVPLPSANATFENEEMARWFDEILATEDLTRADFRNAEKDYAVHGDRRQVFVKPSDVQHRFFQYDDPTIPLALSDYDRLQGKPEPETVSNGRYLALSISFSLPPGSYATMAIRELCRMDTGKQYQKSLNDYAGSEGPAEEAEDVDETGDA